MRAGPLVFAGLTRLDDAGVPFPDLAETWTISQDGLTYTFVLRNGLVWHDGASLTADDVVFTYELLRNEELRRPPELAAILAEADNAGKIIYTSQRLVTAFFAVILVYGLVIPNTWQRTALVVVTASLAPSTDG